MRILLTGRNGQVGWELQRALAPVGQVIALGHSDLDLASADAISKAVRAARPDIIVNAAAYNAVDRAESEPLLARLVNGVAPGVLADEARRLGAVFVHYSTDYVFDGGKNGAYVEDDVPAPINEYGRSKLAGEQAIRSAGGRYCILRTSWVYAARGTNFLNTILRLAQERPELKVVDDQIGAPTWARYVAEATARVLGSICAEPARELSGLYHLAASGAVSWFGFAHAILEATKSAFPTMNLSRLEPVSSAQYLLPARRPHNSRLDGSRLSDAFGLVLPSWECMLKECLREKAADYAKSAAA